MTIKSGVEAACRKLPRQILTRHARGNLTPFPTRVREAPQAMRAKEITMSSNVDHDTWNTSIPKLKKASKIKLAPIHGVMPFDGVRNPSARSSVSQKVFLTYRTAANEWRPKVGIGESAAEIAVALEALMAPTTHDLHFQPLTVGFRDEDGRSRSYTHDILITFTNGHRRLVFVRNGSSLSKPRTWREINAIVAATPKAAADDLVVVNANDYSRQRRDNLIRMHNFVFHPDPEADNIVLSAARSLKTLWHMQDLFPHVPISQRRAFGACHRLIASGAMRANLDHVLWEYPRIEVAEAQQ